MSERPVIVPADARANQAKAGTPRASAWVGANAGSGKTFILARRVLRLLLAGAAPQSILCLTYTKAAAAEMRHRVSDILARWARQPDEALAGDLADVLGTPAGAAERRRARTLFAHALETPGGLKINTIHAFCEAVLHRFPLEAGVPVNFSVIEDARQAEMMLAARETVLAEGLRGEPKTAAAVAWLFTHMSDSQIEGAIAEGLLAGRKLDPVLLAPEAAAGSLRDFLGLGAHDTLRSIGEAVLGETLVPVADYARILALTPPGRAARREFEDKLAEIDRARPRPDQIFAAFLTGAGTAPRRGFPNKAIVEAEPALAERLTREAERLERLYERYKGAQLAERSEAIVTVLGAIVARYEADKRDHALLDFDDLVARAGRLFANAEYGAWVRYKLDAGIDHILVDESQDTNPEQWAVIAALADDFFSGDGAAQRPKTLFAVGDPKQSIYSFQGAEPRLFAEMGSAFRRRADHAAHDWHHLQLRTSFRTLPGILSGVDAVCARSAVGAALFADQDGIRHESARSDPGGAIELWPTEPQEKSEAESAFWPLEPVENLASAPRRIARRIASAIAHWTESHAPLGPRGRAIRPDDILILVQRRGEVFREIVKALKDAHISSPGADRLPVSAHIAVDDLLGLTDVLLNPADDLLLAAILRSPLFEFSEERLYALAEPREKNQPLWSALGASALPDAQDAFARLTALRSRLDFDRPYEFFAHVLYAEGGLKRFHARLGLEVDEVIAEFLDLALDHERSDQPSLTGFLARMRASDIVIKRDLVQKAAGVRIMTVHGAKGLEAPVVILADATTTPPGVRDTVFLSDHLGAPFLLHCGRKEDHTARSLPLREALAARQTAEYWRNLYVGMTRAEDLLIATGPTDEKGRTEGSWYGTMLEALAPDAESVTRPDIGLDVLRYPKDSPAPAPVQHSVDILPTHTPLSLGAPRRRTPIEVLSPSLIGAAGRPETVFETAGEALLDAGSAKARGIALHALLQHLGNVPANRRTEVALSAAQVLLAEHPALAVPVAEDALALLALPEFTALFGSAARAEVSFALDMERHGKPVRLAGRIDRLVADGNRVLVVDYKSDAQPPHGPAGVSPAYLMQLGLYRLVAARLFPHRTVEAAILWTATRRLMVLPDAALDAATSAFTLPQALSRRVETGPDSP